MSNDTKTDVYSATDKKAFKYNYVLAKGDVKIHLNTEDVEAIVKYKEERDGFLERIAEWKANHPKP